VRPLNFTVRRRRMNTLAKRLRTALAPAAYLAVSLGVLIVLVQLLRGHLDSLGIAIWASLVNAAAMGGLIAAFAPRWKFKPVLVGLTLASVFLVTADVLGWLRAGRIILPDPKSLLIGGVIVACVGVFAQMAQLCADRKERPAPSNNRWRGP
jgi:hypothetical protein